METQSGWSSTRAMDDLVARGTIVLGGPVGDGERVVLVCEAASTEALTDALADDPWTDSHLIDVVEPLCLRLDARRP